MTTGVHKKRRSGDEEYFCECAGYTETALRKAIITRRLRTVSDVRRETGVGKCCSNCREALVVLLREIWNGRP